MGPTPSSPRNRLPQPITTVLPSDGVPNSASTMKASSQRGSAAVTTTPLPCRSHVAVDDELGQLLAGLAVVGVDRAHQARVEAASDETKLDRVLDIGDWCTHQCMFDRAECALTVAWSDVPGRRCDDLVVL